MYTYSRMEGIRRSFDGSANDRGVPGRQLALPVPEGLGGALYYTTPSQSGCLQS